MSRLSKVPGEKIIKRSRYVGQVRWVRIMRSGNRRMSTVSGQVSKPVRVSGVNVNKENQVRGSSEQGEGDEAR